MEPPASSNLKREKLEKLYIWFTTQILWKFLFYDEHLKFKWISFNGVCCATANPQQYLNFHAGQLHLPIILLPCYQPHYLSCKTKLTEEVADSESHQKLFYNLILLTREREREREMLKSCHCIVSINLLALLYFIRI